MNSTLLAAGTSTRPTTAVTCGEAPSRVARPTRRLPFLRHPALAHHRLAKLVVAAALLFLFNVGYWGLRIWGHGLWVVYLSLAALVWWRYPTRLVRGRVAILLVVQYCFEGLIDWLPAALGGGQGGYTPYLFLYWPLAPQAVFVGASHGWERAATMYTIWGVVGALVILPAGAYFRGKRFYCTVLCRWSLVADTLGEPFRAQAPRGKWAERLQWLSAVLLGLVVVCTFLRAAGLDPVVGPRTLNQWYQLIFINYLTFQAGIGVIPVFGARAKCRYNCPMGTYLGFFQTRGRFRLAADESKCIKCVKCDDACDMGIPVMRFAVAGGLLNSAQCTGCGMCTAACPTNVLGFSYAGDRHAARY